MTHIIAFAGKKQSGKSTAANFMHGHEIQRADETKTWNYRINDKGQLVVRTVAVVDGEEKYDEGVLDVNQRNYKFARYAENNIWPFIKAYSFAEVLKDICTEVLGLTYLQCHGSDEDKNSPTQYRWENMPGVISEKDLPSGLTKADLPDTIMLHEPGVMTGREMMQYVGTDLFRRISGDVWVDCCIKNIQEEESDIAVISDCRFLNEVKAIKAAGGKVIKFTRNFNSSDGHSSENDLDNFDGFDAVIDNTKLTVDEQNRKVLELLVYWGVTSYIRPKMTTTAKKPGT